MARSSPILVALWAAAFSRLPFTARAQTSTSETLNAVLANITEVSTFYNALQLYPDIMLQLPNYDGVTLVVPTNAAFNKSQQTWDPQNATLVTSTLEYHIMQGTVAMGGIEEGPNVFETTYLTDPAYTNVTGGQRVIVAKQAGDAVVFTSGMGTRSTLLEADVTFAGGLVQVVDTLLEPPVQLETTVLSGYTGMTAFVAALYKAGLVDEFALTPNVTIFAPDNTAFQAVAGALENLSTTDLAAVLRYHMLPGQYLPSLILRNATNYTTAAPGNPGLWVTRAGNNMYVDSAQVVQPDILLANGVVHMIDNVLNPNDSLARPDPALPAQSPVYAQTGPTSTDFLAPTPFTSYLPCTVSCPVPTANASANATDSDGPVSTSTAGNALHSSSHGAAAAARCTGLGAVGVGAGLLGVGMGMAGLV